MRIIVFWGKERHSGGMKSWEIPLLIVVLTALITGHVLFFQYDDYTRLQKPSYPGFQVLADDIERHTSKMNNTSTNGNRLQDLDKIGTSDNVVDREWLSQRQHLLSLKRPAKVFMLAYMRGGSSFGGELFNRDPKGVLWYEPLDQFYMAYHGAGRWGLPMSYTMNSNLTQRSLTSQDKSWFVDYFKDIFTCNYEHLPTEAMTHVDFISQSRALRFMTSCASDSNGCKSHIRGLCGSFGAHTRDMDQSWRNKCPQIIQLLKRLNPPTHSAEIEKEITTQLNITSASVSLKPFFAHHTCMRVIKAKLSKCLKKAVGICNSSRLHAVEVLRANMMDLEDLIREVPDIFVIYYVRDPRAIAASVLNVANLRSNKTIGKSMLAEVKYICSKMAADVREYRRLDRKFPGVFLLTKYENLVLDSATFGRQVYSHLGLADATKEWKVFVKGALHAKSDGGGTFGVVRSNGAASVDKWRKHLDSKQLMEINDFCGETLDYLSYNM